MRKKNTRSGRITFRTTPEIHQQLAEIAKELGFDINAVLNMLIHRELGPLKAQAKLFRHYFDQVDGPLMSQLLEAWQNKHPNGEFRTFLSEFRKYVLGFKTSLTGLVVEQETPA